VEAIVVAAISAAGAIAVALINARASRQRPALPTTAVEVDDDAAATAPERPGPLARAWERLWQLFGRLAPPNRTTRPWLAGLLGFLFSGFGVALYFRKGVDVIAGIVFLLPLGLMTNDSAGEDPAVAWWYWPFAALTAAFGVLRSESANRRLERELA
jgi:hypothetical protein